MDKDKPKYEFYIMYAICALFFLYYIWHTVICYDTGNEITFLEAFREADIRIKESPFDLYATRHFIRAMFLSILAAFIGFRYIFFVKRKTLFGREQGSGRWSTNAEAKKLADKKGNEDRNMILTDDVHITMDTRQTFLNNNILVVGGSGSGKTRYLVKPNLMQCGSSYVITDPKGELLKSVAYMLKQNGYVIKVLNLIDRTHSDCYNPMAYIHKPSDAYKLTNQIIKNTNPEGKTGAGADPFWEKSEILLIYALILYMWMELESASVNFKTLMKLISMAYASEEDESRKSELDYIFEDLEERKGDEYLPVAIYKDFKKAAGKTAKTILISIAARMNPFRMPDVQDMTLTDTMELDKVGNRKTALFILTSDSDQSFNFMASILYSQLFNELYFVADFGKLGWENNRIRFRTPQSLHRKWKKLLKATQMYNKVVADNQRFLLYQKIRKIIQDCEYEFGLPYKDFPVWNAEKGCAVYKNTDGSVLTLEAYVKEYAETMTSCMLRLKNRRGTLERYLKEYQEQKEVIRTFRSQQEVEAVRRRLRECCAKKEVIEERIAREFGIEKMTVRKPKGIFRNREKDRKHYEHQKKMADKHFLEDVQALINDLSSRVYEYGSRGSLEAKLEKIKQRRESIKKINQTISGLSRRQHKIREELQLKLKELERQIRFQENLVRYEFGLKDIPDFGANGGRLPVPVQCMLDEFANITPIPDFDKLIATMRSRNISAVPILQNISQLKAMYEKEWETIAGNCDSFLFLGGKEPSTVEYLQKQLGKATIDKRSTSHSTGHQGSFSKSWDVLGRELMSTEEITTLDTKECILIVRGYFPFRSRKYDLTRHKRYALLADSDSDPRNYIVEKEIQTDDVSRDISKSEIMDDNGVFELELDKEIDRFVSHIERNRPIGGDISPGLFSAENISQGMGMQPQTLEVVNQNIQEMLTERMLKAVDAGKLELETMVESDLYLILDDLKKEIKQEKLEKSAGYSPVLNLQDYMKWRSVIKKEVHT